MTQHKHILAYTYHRRSKLIDDDAIANEVIAFREQLIANDGAFQAALHRALEAGAETDEGVRGGLKQARSKNSSMPYIRLKKIRVQRRQ